MPVCVCVCVCVGGGVVVVVVAVVVVVVVEYLQRTRLKEDCLQQQTTDSQRDYGEKELSAGVCVCVWRWWWWWLWWSNTYSARC